jgi:23S rRNA (cytosine1962-C5)-methyltransferase
VEWNHPSPSAMIRQMAASHAPEVRLVDAGDGRRLERFGPRLVDRPAPVATAPRRDIDAWRAADLRFVASAGWSSPGGAADTGAAWPVQVDGLTLELRPTASGGVGLYPEHAANVAWLWRAVAVRSGGEAAAARPRGEAAAARATGVETAAAPSVLNLFAHTGLATLALARAGAAVAHVDAARSAVAWARRNVELSGLADRPIRWLVDDALGFVEREARRGRRYDGFVLDPPSFGRAPSGGHRSRWSLRDGLPDLLAGCAAIAANDAFVLLTAHTTGTDPEELAGIVADAFGHSRAIRGGTLAGTRGVAQPAGRGATRRATLEPTVEPLTLVAESGARLDLGWAVRLDPLDAAP